MMNSKFSARERDVIAHLLEGKSNKQIALALGISASTVEFHLRNIYAKLEVSSRAEAILKLGKSIGETASSKLRESIVDEEVQSGENNSKSFSPRRISMKNLVYIGGLLTTILIIAFIVTNNTVKTSLTFPSSTVTARPIPATATPTIIPTPTISPKEHILEQIRQLMTAYDQAVKSEKQNGDVEFGKDPKTAEDIFLFKGESYTRISTLRDNLWNQVNQLIKLYGQEYRDQINPTPFPTETSSDQHQAYYEFLLTQSQVGCSRDSWDPNTALASFYDLEDGKYHPFFLNDETARCDVYGIMIDEWRVAPVLAKVNKEADISMIRQIIGEPDLQLTFDSISDDPNAPGRNLALYDDNTGKKYYMDVDTARLMEITSNFQSQPNIHASESKSIDELRGIARQFASTNSPRLAQLENVLLYEENCKGDICFFRWDYRSKDWSGTDWVMMPPFLQVGVLTNGQIVTYNNTLDLFK